MRSAVQTEELGRYRRQIVALVTAWRSAAALHHHIHASFDGTAELLVLLLAHAPVELLSSHPHLDDHDSRNATWQQIAVAASEQVVPHPPAAAALPTALTLVEHAADGAGEHTTTQLDHDSLTSWPLTAALTATLSATIDRYANDLGEDPEKLVRRWGAAVAH